MIQLEYWGNTIAVSGIWYNRFTVNREEGNIFFCYDESGGLHVGDTQISPSSQITLYSGEAGYWQYDLINGHSPSKTYINIEIKGKLGNEDNIYIGYAVIEVINNEDYDYSATVIKLATFPMIDNNAQYITKEQMNILFDIARKK